MASADVPGLGPEVLEELADKHGSQWEELVVQKWGADWGEPVTEELNSTLGQGWESQSKETKSEGLWALIEPASATTSSSGGSSESVAAAGENAYVSVEGLDWIKTLAEVSSFEDWLVRIGVAAETVESLARTAGSGPAESSAATTTNASVSVEGLDWIKTLAEVSSFEDWLIRIGVAAETVTSLAKYAGNG
jgi:hypothetical protein